jgi:hypothetical protein
MLSLSLFLSHRDGKNKFSIQFYVHIAISLKRIEENSSFGLLKIEWSLWSIKIEVEVVIMDLVRDLLCM